MASWHMGHSSTWSPRRPPGAPTSPTSTSSDKLLYDYHTQQLYSIDPVFINGEIADYNAELIATIHYDVGSFQVSTADFFV